jgi:hypothetical protein
MGTLAASKCSIFSLDGPGAAWSPAHYRERGRGGLRLRVVEVGEQHGVADLGGLVGLLLLQELGADQEVAELWEKGRAAGGGQRRQRLLSQHHC